jgi:hygromycin-B 4-O-kinase
VGEVGEVGTVDTIDAGQARTFLAERFGPDVSAVELVGAGAWSQAFGFRRGGEELVVRFGRHQDDFEKDRRAHAYAGPDLPVPAVLAIGEVFDGYYAVSTRVRGAVLEQLEPDAWRAAVPALAAAMEALRTADLSGTAGYGGWGADGAAPHQSWPEYLLRVADDSPDRRTYGWRARLLEVPGGADAFAWGYELLRAVADDSAPRCLIHADLMNRNVLVAGERLAGVFDWGCSAYGDHLYELAWFEFWAPWHPNLDVPLLRDELERRWRAAGYAPPRYADRLLACHLHIGLDHLAYNAYRGDAETLLATAERMRALAGGL